MVVLWRSEWWCYGGVSGGVMEEWVVVLWRSERWVHAVSASESILPERT